MNQIFETPVGFLKSETLVNAELAHAQNLLDDAAFKALQDAQIAELVSAQKAAGLKIITDGGFRNLFGLRDFWMEINGVTPTVVTSGHVYQEQNSGEVIPRVTDKLAHNPAHYILDSFSSLQHLTDEKDLQVRVDIPAPAQYLVELVRNDWYDTSVYPSVDDMAADLSTAYNGILKDLYARGCRRLLLVDPAWGRLCDPVASKRLLQGGINLIELPNLMRRVNEDAIKDLPADMHIILYVPVETTIHSDCSDVVNQVIAHDRIDSFMFDWQDDEAEILPFISSLKPGKEIIIGIGDPKQPYLENRDEIAQICANISNINPNIDIRVTIKGGFVNNTDSIDFSTVTDTIQWSKIENLIDL